MSRSIEQDKARRIELENAILNMTAFESIEFLLHIIVDLENKIIRLEEK